jgi:S1-C subfamily serine protease
VLIPYTFHRYESVRTGTIEAEVSVLISGQTRTFSVKAVHFDSATGTRGVLDTDKQGNRNRSARFPSVQEFWETAFVEFKRRIRSGLEEPLRELIGRVLRNHLDAGRDVDALLWAMWYDNVNPDMQLTTSIFSGFDLRRPAGIPASNIDALDELIPALSTRTMRAPPIKGEALNLDLVLKAVVSIGTEEAGGSGFFVSHDGLLVTNYHVIEGARQIVVETSDGDQFLARLELSDVDRDLALLRVPYRPAAVLDLVRQGPPRLGASSSTSTTFLCFISGPSAYLHVPYVLGSFRMNAAGIPVAWLRAVTTGSPPISRPAKISVASGRSRVISRAISRNSIGSDSN